MFDAKAALLLPCAGGRGSARCTGVRGGGESLRGVSVREEGNRGQGSICRVLMWGRRAPGWLPLCTALALAVTASPCALAQTTARVSIGSTGTQGDSHSFGATASGDGRFVAFQSDASNLVAGDTNAAYDVFVHDRQNGLTVRASVGSGGTQANGQSLNPSISNDGRYVAFSSVASNLVPGDSNAASDVFVHDLVGGVTRRISVSSLGAQGNGVSNNVALSGNARYAAFNSTATTLVDGDSNALRDVFLHDLVNSTTLRIGPSSGGSQNLDGQFFPSISADGRFVAFQSGAATLVAGDTNGVQDVFVFDRTNGSIERISVDAAGQQGPFGASYNPSLSADGRFVVFDSQSPLLASDTNASLDVYLRDRQTGAVERASVGTGGGQSSGFSGNANNPSVSADGRFVAFGSLSSNLVAGDTNGVFDRFVRDRASNTTFRISVTSAGAQSDTEGGSTGDPQISDDGSNIVFSSFATNLVAGDTNSASDVFVRDLLGNVDRLFENGFEP
jgi:Tol biopolymer transport system component